VKRGAEPFTFECRDVAGAEAIGTGRHRTMLVLQRHDGGRYRFQFLASRSRVAAALERALVPEARAAQAPNIRVGDRVRVRDGREGAVVAVVPRERDSGHLEVFVRLADSGVDSWDSSEVSVLP
jgi:hypothetical protein